MVRLSRGNPAPRGHATGRRPRLQRGRLERPESDVCPEGIKYRFHSGTIDGQTILRYDNSHGVHERHTPAGVSIVDFPDLWQHYRRFRMEVERL